MRIRATRVAQIGKQRPSCAGSCFFGCHYRAPLSGSILRTRMRLATALFMSTRPSASLRGVHGLAEFGDEVQDIQDPNYSAPRHSRVALFQPVERLFEIPTRSAMDDVESPRRRRASEGSPPARTSARWTGNGMGLSVERTGGLDVATAFILSAISEPL